MVFYFVRFDFVSRLRFPWLKGSWTEPFCSHRSYMLLAVADQLVKMALCDEAHVFKRKGSSASANNNLVAA